MTWPSSRCRVDGVEVDAAIQDERAVNLISTQVDAVDDQDVVVLAAGVDVGHEHDEVHGELAVEVGADDRDVPAVGPAGAEFGLPASNWYYVAELPRVDSRTAAPTPSGRRGIMTTASQSPQHWITA